jgi:hypothetical protein
MKKLILIVVCILLNIGRDPFCDTGPKKLPNIIVINISGASNSDTINDPSHQFMPNLWNVMFKEGVLYKNLKVLPLTFHTPSGISICAGTEYAGFPVTISSMSIFTYIGKKYNLPKTKIWCINHISGMFDDNLDLQYPACLSDIFGPNKIDIADKFINDNPDFVKQLEKNEQIFFEKYIELRKKNILIWPLHDSNSEVIYDLVKKLIAFYKPVFIFYVMDEPESAHSDTYARYVLGLKDLDNRILGIWNLINTDPYYKGNTYLFVTVDHSRDENYMEHDKTRENVWFYVYGPGIKKGKKIDGQVNSVDIFATIAYIMDVKTDKTNGKILYDSFEKGGLQR